MQNESFDKVYVRTNIYKLRQHEFIETELLAVVFI
jgi:hypothetical protein